MNREQRRRASAEHLAKILLTDPEGGLALLTRVSTRFLVHGVIVGALAGVLLGWVIWE